MSVTRFGVTYTVEVAFADGALVASPTWTDITAYVRDVSISRGRASEFAAYGAGTASLVLSNRDRRFDPTYTAGTYYGQLLPMRQVRISAVYSSTTYRLFRGFIQGWPQQSIQNRDGYVTVEAVDAFGVLGNVELGATTLVAAAQGDATLQGFWRMSAPAGSTSVNDVDLSDLYINGYPMWNLNPGDANPATLAVRTATPVESDRVAVANIVANTSMVATNNRSLEFWVYLNTQNSDPDGQNCYVYWSGSDNLYFHLYPNTGGLELTRTWLVEVEYNAAAPGGTGSYWGSCQAIVGDGVHHIAARVDEGGDGLELYVDGQLRDSDTTSSASISSEDEGVLSGFAGVYIYTDARMAIQNVAAYSTRLSASEILDHYRLGLDGLRLESSGDRIVRILDSVDWPAAMQSIDEGDSYLSGWQPGSATALDACQEIAATEQGRFYVAADGTVTFKARTWGMSATAAITNNWTVAEANYTDVIVDGVTRDTIRNRVTVSGEFGTIRQQDTTSSTAYGTIDESAATLIPDATIAVEWAQWRLWQYAEPQTRVTGLTVAPRGSPATRFPQVLGRELGDRIVVQRTPQGVGSASSYTVSIEGIAHRFTPEGEWDTTWYLVPVLPSYSEQTWWMADHATYGKVDQGHRVPL